MSMDLSVFGDNVINVDEYQSTGELAQKTDIEGVPFVVIDWCVRTSEDHWSRDENGVERPREYVSITVRLEDGRQLVVNDGGAGIRPVLEQHLARTGRRDGLVAMHGLRRSEYKRQTPEGTTKATTWWFG